MSLKIKCVHYNTVHLSTVYDLQLLTDELKVLIANGYKLTLADVSATNTLAQEPWGGSASTLPPAQSHGYEPLASFNVSSSSESEMTSWQPSSLPPVPRMKYYYNREREPHTSIDVTGSADLV
jgi:hypothetical protein